MAAIAAERGLETRGFRKSLKALVVELNSEDWYREMLLDDPPEEGEIPPSLEEVREMEFGEWFGDESPMPVPAAYAIRRRPRSEPLPCRPDIYDVTIEVWEVEGSIEVADWKLEKYGRIAGGDGPHLDLHILDKYDHEIYIPSDELMPAAYLGTYRRFGRKDCIKDLKKCYRSMAKAQHHAPVIIDNTKADEYKRQAKDLRRRLSKAEYADLAFVLREIVYGLGARRTHKYIAKRAGCEPSIVRAVARLLKDQNINPRELVNETHAKWRVAYDSLRELGIQF
jgi:hypothetical protein